MLWNTGNRKKILFYSMPLWSCHKQWDFIGLFQVTLMDGIYNEEWFLRPNTTKKTEKYIWYMSMYECKYAKAFHMTWKKRDLLFQRFYSLFYNTANNWTYIVIAKGCFSIIEKMFEKHSFIAHSKFRNKWDDNSK